MESELATIFRVLVHEIWSHFYLNTPLSGEILWAGYQHWKQIILRKVTSWLSSYLGWQLKKCSLTTLYGQNCEQCTQTTQIAWPWHRRWLPRISKWLREPIIIGITWASKGADQTDALLLEPNVHNSVTNLKKGVTARMCQSDWGTPRHTIECLKSAWAIFALAGQIKLNLSLAYDNFRKFYRLLLLVGHSSIE